MSDTLRTIIDLFVVSIVLIGFGFFDVIDSMSATEMFSAKAIRYVVFTVWLPGLLGFTTPRRNQSPKSIRWDAVRPLSTTRTGR